MIDLTIVGAGLAGLQLARLASRGGASVLLVDARRSVTECVRTTGIFVRKTFEDFPSLDRYLGPPIRSIAVHSPAGRSIELASPRDEFRVGRMAPLYQAMLEQAVAAGAQWRPGTIYAGLEVEGDGVEIHFRDGTNVKSRFLAGADGARSRVARDLGLDLNSQWIAGVESVYPSSSSGHPRFDCWIDPRIAPGYLAWIVDGGEEIHVGVGGDRARFDPMTALVRFETRLRAEGRLAAAKPIQQRGGIIPVNGVLRRISASRGLLVGDAAGAVSPLTAGGLDACMRLSEHAAASVLEALDRDAALMGYDGASYRTRFASRIAMRHLFDLGTRSHRLIELGFMLGATPAARRLVRHVFFGRRSFPDTRPAGARSARCGAGL
ncbi:MAG TPA: NAD(P)/FAD-dependent oxidoreductase [Thermoanaerobaculia bacterium]|nr:NAD(P)/FAD-dependent oxidoreductase [Thermoanaerobaculia bacterium]